MFLFLFLYPQLEEFDLSNFSKIFLVFFQVWSQINIFFGLPIFFSFFQILSFIFHIYCYVTIWKFLRILWKLDFEKKWTFYLFTHKKIFERIWDFYLKKIFLL